MKARKSSECQMNVGIFVITVILMCLTSIYNPARYNTPTNNFQRDHLKMIPPDFADNKNFSFLNLSSNFTEDKQKQHYQFSYYQSSFLSLVSEKPLFSGCVNKNDPKLKKFSFTAELKFNSTDCSLFCIGRNFSHVNIQTNENNSTCFCSNDLPVSPHCKRKLNIRTIFKSYKLFPRKIPSLKVTRFQICSITRNFFSFR